MPLLRAVDVRAVAPTSVPTAAPTVSQCPCCGRSMCGPLQEKGAPAVLTVSMPLLRAVDVRALRNMAASVIHVWTVSMPLLRAVDVRVRTDDRTRPPDVSAVSMPLLRAVDVRGVAANSARRGGANGPVSMPLLRAVDVRGRDSTPPDDECTRQREVSMPLLRAVDVRAASDGRRHGRRSSLSQCPCCGRSMCGTPRRDPFRAKQRRCLNALVAGGRCAGSTHGAC